MSSWIATVKRNKLRSLISWEMCFHKARHFTRLSVVTGKRLVGNLHVFIAFKKTTHSWTFFKKFPTSDLLQAGV